MSATALTAEESSRFREDGFFIPKFRFNERDVDRLRRDVMAVVRAHPDFRTEPVTKAHMPKAGDGFASLMPFCVRPEILDMIESIDGPNLILWTTTVFHRPAGEGGFTDWHQDGEFWPITPLAGTSAWVALSECVKENGCLRVIPGSHKSHARHIDSNAGVFSRRLAPDALDESDAVDIELRPGQVMLFDAELIHGSHPNMSDQDRTAFVMRYFPTTSYFDLDGGKPGEDASPPYADRALFLVRGVDRCGRNDLKRNHGL